MNDILNRAADLLEQPNAWCQGSIARDANGERVALTLEPKACSWCIIGAVSKATGFEKTPDGIFERIRNTAVGENEYISIGGWNDAPERTQAEVVAVLRKAAEA
jgi:hypothetical protein